MILKLSRAIWAPGHERLSVSPFSRPSLSSKGQIQTAANQRREGVQRQGRNSQETTVQPWDRILVQSQGIHITISLSSSAELKPPPMEDVPERSSQFDNLEKFIRRPPEARLKECRPCTHPDPYQQPCP